MKEYYSGGERRLWFDPAEVEAMMEDELEKAGFRLSDVNPVADLEIFLERHLRVQLYQHEDLPADVLGVTEFSRGQRPIVKINRDLTEAAWDEDFGSVSDIGRWRSTLAHESAHVLMHRMLFEVPDSQGSLLIDHNSEQGTAPNLMRCLKRDLSSVRTARDWREVQANMGMAALLMPRQIFSRVARPLIDRHSSGEHLGPIQMALVLNELTTTFQVSRQAAEIRLKTLSLQVPQNQRSLP